MGESDSRLARISGGLTAVTLVKIMPRKSTGDYPQNWREIAQSVKDLAGWKCIRCNHPHEPALGYTLTVHHLDLNPANCQWWNLAALCQRCHLHIQSKVVMERTWYLPHSDWFKPYVAGYYAHYHGFPDDKESVVKRVDYLIAFGQGFVQRAYQAVS